MAYPRTGLIIFNNVADVVPSPCATPAPVSSCGNNPGGGGGTGGGGGGGLDPIVVGQILNTNQNVVYYKINLEQTVTNMYGESLEKWYYQGVRVPCNINREATTNQDDEFGVEIFQNITVSIPRAIAQGYNFLPEVGDILMDRERYYELNSLDSQFFTIPGTGAANGVSGTTGQTIMYVLSCYLTRITKLNIIPYYQ
jgi:hypothetical protein